MKKLFLIAAALFTAISFNACTNDDHENSSGHTGIVSRIIQQDENGSTYFYKFDYDDQGRVIKIYILEDDYTTCFSYTYTTEKVEITETGTIDGTDEYRSIHLATLNEQGYIATLKWDTGHADPATYNFFYDKNGCLSKAQSDFTSIWELQYTWNNGDLINEHHPSWMGGWNYEYTSYPAKQSINIFSCIWGYRYEVDIFPINVADLIGRRSAHLIKSANIPYDEYDNRSFSYEFDSNGNPTKITKIRTNKMTSKCETTTYRIFYE